MKVEYTDVSVTEKSLVVEIPTEVVEEQIQRVTHGYARTMKLPGFRPGKVPAKVVRQRFMPQILQDVAEDLIPRAVDDVLRERGVEPVDTPSVKDVSIDEHSRSSSPRRSPRRRPSTRARSTRSSCASRRSACRTRK
jgi:trigger factor